MAIFIYPSQQITATNPSVGLTGTTTPLSATLVAGTDGTDLKALSVNSAGVLALPQGAATSAKQDIGNTSLSNIDSKVIASVVDANNSTTTPLLAGATFTGTATDIKSYGTISVLVASDVAAAAGGFKFQFSNDGSNWDHAHSFDFAGGNLSYNISAEARYFRIQYINGASPQTHFRLQTVLKPIFVQPSQYTIAQTLTDYALSTVTKGVIYGKSTAGGGSYEAVKVNPSGALTVEATVSSSALPTGAATETTLSALNQRLPGGLVPAKFDSITLTYVSAGNGVGEVATAVFKLATTTVATLTLSYDSNNRLTGVVKT